MKASPGLMGFWQTHESFAHPEWSGDKNMIANLNPPPAAIAAHAKQLFTCRRTRATPSMPRSERRQGHHDQRPQWVFEDVSGYALNLTVIPA